MKLKIFILSSWLLVFHICYADTSLAESGFKLESTNITESTAVIASAQIEESKPDYMLGKCSSIGYWACHIAHGLVMAESEGVNGILVDGYAYHAVVEPHLPLGHYKDQYNEFTYGIGYSRAWYNPKSNDEYTLFATVFADSFTRPEMHVGYNYLMYHSIPNSNIKFGFGYSPMLFIKPTWAGGGAAIIPAAGLSGALRYKQATLMATYAMVAFINLRFDLEKQKGYN